MNNSKQTPLLKSIYKFNKIDNFSFNFFTVQFFTVMLFLFYIGLTYAAWGTIPVILLFIYFSFSKKFSYALKSIIAVTAITAFYTFAYILYGKSCNFVVLTYLTTIAMLVMIRNYKFMIYFSIFLITVVAIIIYFDFFGFDYGNKRYDIKGRFDYLFYFVALMITLYLVVLLTTRSKAVAEIITDLKTKNSELIASRAELKKLQVNKESFFAIMSHEIRTPLNAIKGISDILKNNDTNEEERNLLELMDYSTNHLLALVNNILDFTKLNDGAFTLQYSQFNLRKSLHSMFKMNERMALEKGLGFEIETSKDLPVAVFGDQNRINQIVLNLLNNAVEYTKVGSIKMVVGGNYIGPKGEEFQLKISITDTGKGISSDLREKLFQKYASSNTSEKSVGLGLIISKGLIDLMNGSISYESLLNHGTTFYISIPLPVVANSETLFEQVETKFEKKTLKMLLVDDNKINLLVLEKQLKSKLKNSQITLAYNGLEALELIKAHSFDIVLMDVIMPVMDGITATKHIRKLTDERKQHIPIIALTANVGEKDLTECLVAGMNDFVTKPFEINALLKIVLQELQ